MTAWLLKLMLPITFAVTWLQYYGVINWCAQWLDPVFQYLGLPGCGAIVFLTGSIVGTYAGLAVLLSMEFTLRQATILAIMVLISHALPVECAVVKKVGSAPLKMGLLRIIGSFAAAFYLNLVMPEMSQPFGGEVQVNAIAGVGQLMQDWLLSSLRLTVMMFGIIYALMIVQRVMNDYGIMHRLVKPLEPLMRILGLPQNASYLWLVGNVLGISYGSAMMLELEESGQITKEEANEVNYHLIMNHSMLEDTMVFASAGISALWILSTRMLFAFLLVWLRKGVKRLLR